MVNIISFLCDDVPDEIKEEQELKKIKPNVNEFGDKISFNDICAGILLWACVAGMTACGCIRGCQEIKKHRAQSSEKAKVIQIQHQR